MKKIAFEILMMVALLSCSYCHIATENRSYYKLKKIDSINSYYLLYASRNDSVYKIVAGKELVPFKMKIRAYYDMKLYPHYGYNSKFKPINYLDVRCSNYKNDTEICIEDGCVPELYDLKETPTKIIRTK